MDSQNSSQSTTSKRQRLMTESYEPYCVEGLYLNEFKRILNKDGTIFIAGKFEAVKTFNNDVFQNKEISDFLNVKFQTTLLIFKNNKEVYRSIGEIKKEAIYKALKSSI